MIAEGLYRGSVPGSLLDSPETAEALLLTGPLPPPSGAVWLDSGEPRPADDDDDSSAGSSNLNPHPGPADVGAAGPRSPGRGRPPRGHSAVSGRRVVAPPGNRFRRRTRKARKAMPQQMRTATVRPIVMPTFCLVEKPGWSSAWGPAFGADEANAGGPVMDVDVEAVTNDRLEAGAVIGEVPDAELVVPDAEAEAVRRDEANETKGVWPSLKLMVPRSAVGRVARPDKVGL